MNTTLSIYPSVSEFLRRLRDAYSSKRTRIESTRIQRDRLTRWVPPQWWKTYIRLILFSCTLSLEISQKGRFLESLQLGDIKHALHKYWLTNFEGFVFAVVDQKTFD